MDPKKQDLTPELKQIYDRVMNTQVANKTPAGLNSTPATPISNSPPTTQVPSTNTTNTQWQSAATPLVNPTISQPATTPESVSQPFLSSVPPRPITETKPFVFTGKKIETSNASPEGNQVQANGSKKMSGKIIAASVGVLIILWSVFWAKFFGLF